MSYTAYTAFIITCHHLAMTVALVLAAIASFVLFVFIRHHRHRWSLATIIFIASLVVSGYLVNDALQKAPCSLEIVQTD